MRVWTFKVATCLAIGLVTPIIAVDVDTAAIAKDVEPSRPEREGRYLWNGDSSNQQWPGTAVEQGGKNPWNNDTPIVDKDGRCAAITLEGAKKNGYNCWLIADIENKVAFFIRVNDWNRQTGGLFISPNGLAQYPVLEVWIRGFHGNDKSVPYRWSSSLYRFECGRGVTRFARDQFLTYDANMKLIGRSEQRDEMRIAVPGSKEEKLAWAAC